MNQLNFDRSPAKISFSNMERAQKKTTQRDYSSLSKSRRMIDRIMDERQLKRELEDY